MTVSANIIIYWGISVIFADMEEGKKLIVECGATKTTWCVAGPDGEERRIYTGGINLSTMGGETIDATISEAAGTLACKADEVHFYAAGLIMGDGGKMPPSVKGVDDALRRLMGAGNIEYASDLTAAARALFGHGSGIAVILGTGSNSGFYDGKGIVRSVRSAGFILGDEGSGACLGKLFMADFLKGLMPEEVSREFALTFSVDYSTVVANVYHGSSPSGYLGSFAPWIMERYGKDGYVTRLVERNIKDFMERVLLQYDIDRYEVGVSGGYAAANRDVFERIGAGYGIRFSSFLDDPMDGLVEYHSGKK